MVCGMGWLSEREQHLDYDEACILLERPRFVEHTVVMALQGFFICHGFAIFCRPVHPVVVEFDFLACLMAFHRSATGGQGGDATLSRMANAKPIEQASQACARSGRCRSARDHTQHIERQTLIWPSVFRVWPAVLEAPMPSLALCAGARPLIRFA